MAITVTALVHLDPATADPSSAAAVSGRWYTPEQVTHGREVYQEHCAACHGERAEGAPNWEERGDMGFYPPPPLDGTGHSAHHRLQDMVQTVTMGGTALGGIMPAFVDVFGEPDARAAVAYIQSLWPDEVYTNWVGIDSGAVPPPMPTASEAH
jgi:mono/diheme cytochrome c family protein